MISGKSVQRVSPTFKETKCKKLKVTKQVTVSFLQTLPRLVFMKNAANTSLKLKHLSLQTISNTKTDHTKKLLNTHFLIGCFGKQMEA